MGREHHGNQMRLRRRRWIYDGLGLPPGVAVAAPAPLPGRSIPRQVLLIGDEVAQAVGPPLMRLARDAKVAVLVQARRGSTPADWFEQGWLVDALGRSLPDLLLLGFLANVEADAVDRLARLSTAPVLWLSPLPRAEAVRSDHMRALPVHLPDSPDTMVPTAAGYAAWAGEVWSSMHLEETHG